jgi:hypothetical protein
MGEKRAGSRGILASSVVATSAFASTCLSALIHRTGPQLVQVGNLCGAGGDAPCLQPVLKGGFPVAYIFDAPGVSVEGKLFFEDDFYPWSFAFDFCIYVLVMISIIEACKRLTRRSTGQLSAAVELDR